MTGVPTEAQQAWSRDRLEQWRKIYVSEIRANSSSFSYRLRYNCLNKMAP